MSIQWNDVQQTTLPWQMCHTTSDEYISIFLVPVLAYQDSSQGISLPVCIDGIHQSNRIYPSFHCVPSVCNLQRSTTSFQCWKSNKKNCQSYAEYQLHATSLYIRPIYLQRSSNKNTLNIQHTRYLGPEMVSMRKPPPGGRLRSEQGAMNIISSISNLNREGLAAGASWVSLYEWERFE